jgi:superfamily II DNA helicase RecQ
MGLDFPSIRWVVHAGQSYSVEDYHQETERLSRDGKIGHVISVTSSDFAQKHLAKCSDPAARDALTAWVFAARNVCRRALLTGHFDHCPMFLLQIREREM